MKAISPDSSDLDKMSLVCACVTPNVKTTFRGSTGSISFSWELGNTRIVKDILDLVIDTVLPVTSYDVLENMLNFVSEPRRIQGIVTQASRVFVSNYHDQISFAVKVKIGGDQDVYIDVWELIRIFADSTIPSKLSPESPDQDILNFLAAADAGNPISGVGINFDLFDSFDYMFRMGDSPEFDFSKAGRSSVGTTKSVKISGTVVKTGESIGVIVTTGMPNRFRKWFVVELDDESIYFGRKKGLVAFKIEDLVKSSLFARRYNPIFEHFTHKDGE